MVLGSGHPSLCCPMTGLAPGTFLSFCSTAKASTLPWVLSLSVKCRVRATFISSTAGTWYQAPRGHSSSAV
jgi:hypothetical protein